jgi:hypothetical protein
MQTDFPLWRLRPEDAARIIIMLDPVPVEHHKFWRKRDMRIRPSKRSAPRQEHNQFLAKAGNHRYWSQLRWEHANEFPIVKIRQGPLLRDGGFTSYQPVANALGERQREPWQGMYSRAQYEADFEYIEAARALLRENFILGQRKEGPYLDGIIFMRTDSLLLAEQAHLKARLQTTGAILQAKRSAKLEAKEETWKTIGADEAVALQYKQSGFEIRKIDTLTNRHYEVKLT